MLRTQSNPATGLGGTRRFVLLAVLPVFVLLAALAPASAMAGSSNGDPCSATVTLSQDDPALATFAVDCEEANSNIATVDIRASEDGRSDGDEGTTCTDDPDSARRFDCSPDDPASQISGEFDGDSGDLCASPRLTLDFAVDLEDADPQQINNVEVSGCPGSSSGDEDSGATPEGGVDSGMGGIADRPASTGLVIPLGAAAIVVLASVALFVRRTRTTP